MNFFWWRKPKVIPEPPVLWKQSEREWVWAVHITERNLQGQILAYGTQLCESAEVAADVITKFCGNKEKNYSTRLIKQTVVKNADEANWT